MKVESDEGAAMAQVIELPSPTSTFPGCGTLMWNLISPGTGAEPDVVGGTGWGVEPEGGGSVTSPSAAEFHCH